MRPQRANAPLDDRAVAGTSGQEARSRTDSRRFRPRKIDGPLHLHRLDPETYLRDFFRVLPHWRRDRYLELAPKYWAATRARLDADELARELGPLVVPAPAAAEQEAPADVSS